MITARDVWAFGRQFLRNRRLAYLRVFNTENRDVQVVLSDLASFCRADRTTVVPGDPVATAVLEGRREAWLRVNQHLHLSEETLWQLYDGRPEPTERQ